MTAQEKEEKRENFVAWVTFIEDRVDEWKAGLPESISSKLTYKIDSLDVIESYFLANFTRDSIKDVANKYAIDAFASYIGETLRLHWPNAKWVIELDDKDSVDFNTPVIKVPVGSGIPPYALVRRVLLENRGNYLTHFYHLRLGFINDPGTL
ncbi:hypothetical protein QNI16_18300 [Cytophagaceae bacterium YF14B1]|uniref:Uncharacterized protein n=1 Tax=Xanthocytophaga flava TaxID=3048013 RepID=A0AAE3U7I6_9BACT|nr:hypothetical protein [Xanthocytophaga flavus]MDJ1482461.1 hypothetical protein [Xanthocytophaga flavus]